MKAVYAHGTVVRYNRGCHCSLCREAMADYKHSRRGIKSKRFGSRITFDARKMLCEIVKQNLTPYSLERKTGISNDTIYAMLKRGHCGTYTLDTVACALGHHPCEFSAEWFV